MNSKQRAYLRSMAHDLDAIYQIGKAGVTPELIDGIKEALEKRELVKISVLKNCFEDMKEVATKVSERSRSEVIQVIGRKIVLYKESRENKTIDLP